MEDIVELLGYEDLYNEIFYWPMSYPKQTFLYIRQVTAQWPVLRTS